MSGIRKIQFLLLFGMALLIAVVIGNFNNTQVKKTAKTVSLSQKSGPVVSGGTRMENGVHVLYRNGDPYATVHFKVATQEKKDRVELKSPVLEISGVTGKIEADFATIQGNKVVLRGKIRLFSPENGASVSLAPPAVFTEGTLSGTGKFRVRLKDGTFKGKGFLIKINADELVGEDGTEFVNSTEGLRIESETGVVNYKNKTFGFLGHVQLTVNSETRFFSTGDAVFLDTVTGKLCLIGRGRILFSSGTLVRFPEATLRQSGGGWNGDFPTVTSISQKGKICFFPNTRLQNNRFFFPRSTIQSKDQIFNTGAGYFSLSDSEFSAKRPLGNGKKASLKGEKIFSHDIGKGVKILHPEIRKMNRDWLVADRGEFRQNGTIQMTGNVIGELEDRILSADTASMRGGTVYLKNAIVWDEMSRSFSISGSLELTGKQLIANNGYYLKRFGEKNSSVLTVSSDRASVASGGPRRLLGHVKTNMEQLNVLSREAFIYNWGAIFLDAVFSGNQIKKGKAGLVIISEKSHNVWMLDRADVTDRNGNRITGQKLTLSTITGRISVYSGNKKVRVKLVL